MKAGKIRVTEAHDGVCMEGRSLAHQIQGFWIFILGRAIPTREIGTEIEPKIYDPLLETLLSRNWGVFIVAGQASGIVPEAAWTPAVVWWVRSLAQKIPYATDEAKKKKKKEQRKKRNWSPMQKSLKLHKELTWSVSVLNKQT